MRKIILVYGLIAGSIVAISMVWGIWANAGDGESMAVLEYMGYLIMLIALSVIFFGIKKYRDDDLGGVISFGAAALVGLGISLVASSIYIVVWEIYLAQTDYAFMNDYIASQLSDIAASGATPAELEAAAASFATIREQYQQPLYRLGITLLEIFPVGLLITLISAAILRKSEVLPANQ